MEEGYSCGPGGGTRGHSSHAGKGVARPPRWASDDGEQLPRACGLPRCRRVGRAARAQQRALRCAASRSMRVWQKAPSAGPHLFLQDAAIQLLIRCALEPHLDPQPPHLRSSRGGRQSTCGLSGRARPRRRQGAVLQAPPSQQSDGNARRWKQVRSCSCSGSGSAGSGSTSLPKKMRRGGGSTHLLHAQEDPVAPRSNVLLNLVHLQRRKVLQGSEQAGAGAHARQVARGRQPPGAGSDDASALEPCRAPSCN